MYKKHRLIHIEFKPDHLNINEYNPTPTALTHVSFF